MFMSPSSVNFIYSLLLNASKCPWYEVPFTQVTNILNVASLTLTLSLPIIIGKGRQVPIESNGFLSILDKD